MSRSYRRERQLTVTDEPFGIAPTVLGRELATVRRRAAAITIDGLVWIVGGTPLLLLAATAALYVQAPAMGRAVVRLISGQPGAMTNRATAELLQLVARRQPSALPARFQEPLAAGDLDAVESALDRQSLSVFFDPGDSEPSYYEPALDRLHLHRDVLFGPFASAFGYGALGLVYFTLSAWIGRGRTLGKWLFGVRAVKLDGSSMRLWDAFGRAGGYAASLSTLGIGFFEARWDLNRQALHDRVAGTVVIRDPRRRLLGRWGRASA